MTQVPPGGAGGRGDVFGKQSRALLGDYRLTPAGAAAIDHGVTISGVTADVGGMARPQGAACDLGANQQCDRQSRASFAPGPTRVSIMRVGPPRAR